MKTLLKMILGIIVFLILVVVVMAVFRICPPPGPWPMPPWCSREAVSTIPVGNGQIISDAVIKWEDASFEPAFAPGTALGVNMFDTWGRNYNMRMLEDTRNQIDESFSRLQNLGAKEVYVHDFFRAVYEKDKPFTANSTEYKIEGDIFTNDQRDQEITADEMDRLAKSARDKGMKIAWRSNFTFINTGKYIGSSNIAEALAKDWQEFDKPKNKEWVDDFFNKWEQTLLQKAENLNEAGFDIMIITPHFMNPEFSPEEELANKRWKETIINVKKAFKGKVGVIVHREGFIGESSRDDWHKYDYYKDADLIYYFIEYILPKYKPSLSPDFTEMKDKFSLYLDDLERKATAEGIKISLIFSFSSYKDAVTQGYVEFSDVLNPYVRELEADYQHQAEATEAMFRALENRKQFEKIILFGYWWDDVTDQKNGGILSKLPMPRISISPSPRNKPAETVFAKWCKAWYDAQ